jgi:cell division protein FtsN
MFERDSQSIVLSRQAILLVTAVSVGLLTLCYVLGVQVGKQSAAIHQTSYRGSGEDLQDLPSPIQDQVKAIDSNDLEKPAAPAAVPKPTATNATPPAEEAKPAAPKPAEAAQKPEAKPEAAKPEDAKWTLQLVATSDAAEAERVAAKAKAAGFATTTVKDKGAFKVRLAKPGSKADIDATETKLKAKGFKPFAIKVG